MRLSTLAFVALFTLGACAGDGKRTNSDATGDAGMSNMTTGGSGARDACMAYINRYNELPCTSSAPLDAATTCPASTNWSACGSDFVDYWNCLTNGLACMDVGGTSVLDASGATACGTAAPTCL